MAKTDLGFAQVDATVAEFDADLWSALQCESQRQEDHVELIASENYASPRVLALQGSVLTNKYAEGYPGKRYYGGCEFVDVAERIAIERAKQLFKADYANVQPHSGSQANCAVMQALLTPGDTILGMDLASGGHLTHGCKVNFSGKVYQSVSYGVHADSGEIDYAQVEALAQQHRPKLLVTGFSAYSRVVDWQRMRAIADSVGAYMLADMAHVAGLVAAGLYPSPVGIADVTTTTTHKTLRGPRGGLILARANPEIEKKLQSAIFPGIQGGPLMHVVAAKAMAFLEAMQPEFITYQRQVIKNAQHMAQVLMQRGFKVVSGGTEDHMFLLDLTEQGVTGKEVEALLEQVHITVNKNAVPGDKRSPFVTSGIRIGTPAVTTRGFAEPEVERLAHWIADAVLQRDDQAQLARIAQEVTALCRKFPVYASAVTA